VTGPLRQAAQAASNEQLARLALEHVGQAKGAQLERAGRTYGRIGSVLGLAASVLALYDLSLFARLIP